VTSEEYKKYIRKIKKRRDTMEHLAKKHQMPHHEMERKSII